MSKRVDCICTEFTLITPEGEHYAADLYQRGDVYVAVANMEVHDLVFVRDRTATLKFHVWERRGVYIFGPDDAVFSDALNDYIGNE